MDDVSDPSINSGQDNSIPDSALQPGSGQANSPQAADTSQPEDATTGGAMPEAPEGQGVGLEAESAEIPPIVEGPLAGSGQEPQPTEVVTPQAITPSEVAPSEANPSFIKNLLAKAGEKIQFNKRKKLDKVMELARKKGSVVNSDVEKLLYVSHTTASRYLRQLVKENKLKVSGKSVDSKYEPV